jgi:hypothetical protein
MLHAIAGVNELLRKDFHGVALIAALEAAKKFQVQHFRVIVLEDHVLDFDAFELFLVLRPLLDIAMQVAIFRDRVAPEFTTATRFLANLELDAFFLFVLG